jgi:hypothetical protein
MGEANNQPARLSVVVARVGSEDIIEQTVDAEVEVLHCDETVNPAHFFNKVLESNLGCGLTVFLKKECNFADANSLQQIINVYNKYKGVFSGMYSDYWVVDRGISSYRTEPAYSELAISAKHILSPIVLFENPTKPFNEQVISFLSHYAIKQGSKDGMFYYCPKPLFIVQPALSNYVPNLELEKQLVATA